MIGYDRETAFVEVLKHTASLTAVDLGYSVPGDRVVLPLKYAAWIVDLGEARFL